MKKKRIPMPLYWGTWGNLRATYLQENHPDVYYALQESGNLEDYLDSYQEAYILKEEKLKKKYEVKFHCDPALKHLNYALYLHRKMQVAQAIYKDLSREIRK